MYVCVVSANLCITVCTVCAYGWNLAQYVLDSMYLWLGSLHVYGLVWCAYTFFESTLCVLSRFISSVLLHTLAYLVTQQWLLCVHLHTAHIHSE